MNKNYALYDATAHIDENILNDVINSSKKTATIVDSAHKQHDFMKNNYYKKAIAIMATFMVIVITVFLISSFCQKDILVSKKDIIMSTDNYNTASDYIAENNFIDAESLISPLLKQKMNENGEIVLYKIIIKCTTKDTKNEYSCIKENYNLTKIYEPIDFYEISKEDYLALAIASYDSIYSLASNGYMVFLAPENELNATPLSESDDIREILQKYNHKMSERIKRNLFYANIDFEAVIELRLKDIDNFNSDAAKELGFELDSSENIDNYSQEFLSVRYSIYQKYRDTEQLKFAQKYEITPVKTGMYFICKLNQDQVKEILKDDSLFFISDYVEIQAEGSDF